MTNKRYEDVRNTVVRDAESYFITRSRVGSHSWKKAKSYASLYWTEASIWYDRGKKVTNPVNRAVHFHWLQSQDRNPNSEPGGVRWALRGVEDGKLDDPNSEARPSHCVLTPYYDETTP